MGTGAWGQDLPLLRVANDGFLKIDHGGVLLPAMYDSDAEQALVVDLFERYNKVELPTRSTPGSTVWRACGGRARVPLLRDAAAASPRRRVDADARVGAAGALVLLHLPRYRCVYDDFERVLFAFAVAGAWLVWRRDAALVDRRRHRGRGARGAARVAHPFPVERYMVESFPAMMALAGCGVARCYAGGSQPPSVRDTRSRRSWPQYRCSRTRNDGTPQTPAARASSVLARSASLAAGVSIAADLRSRAARRVGDVAILDPVGAEDCSPDRRERHRRRSRAAGARPSASGSATASGARRPRRAQSAQSLCM